jgi:hypothetical protein
MMTLGLAELDARVGRRWCIMSDAAPGGGIPAAILSPLFSLSVPFLLRGVELVGLMLLLGAVAGGAMVGAVFGEPLWIRPIMGAGSIAALYFWFIHVPRMFGGWGVAAGILVILESSLILGEMRERRKQEENARTRWRGF